MGAGEVTSFKFMELVPPLPLQWPSGRLKRHETSEFDPRGGETGLAWSENTRSGSG